MISEAQRLQWNAAVTALAGADTRENRDELARLRSRLLDDIFRPHIDELMALQARGRQDAPARPDRTPGGPHPVPPGTARSAADVALTAAPGDPNPPHQNPSPAWCRDCRQRGYASAHCAAVAAAVTEGRNPSDG